MTWDQVSIPHRYAENKRSLMEKDCRNTVSIPHRYAENDNDSPSAFTTRNRFQFLIGTLRTKHLRQEIRNQWRVSIPHRYAENASSFVQYPSYLTVSIPHRYAENVTAID